MKRSTASAPNLSPKHEDEAEMKKVKIEAAPTGRQIIEQYLKGDVSAAVTYRKICNALESFEQWESEVPKLQLLDQFLTIADVLDVRTEALVRKLLGLRWDKIPGSAMLKFRNFICELAIRHLCFTEEVYVSVVERMVPLVNVDAESGVVSFVLDEQVQKEHFEMAHYIVSSVIRCFPLSAKTLLKCVKKGMPHFTRPTVTVSGYMRNVILMQKYIPKSISKELWVAVFERLSRDDAHNWDCEKKEEESKSPRLFALNEEILLEMLEEKEKEHDGKSPKQVALRKGEQATQYLDSVITDIIHFIKSIESTEQPHCLNDLKLQDERVIELDELFDTFLEVLETTMLHATHVQYVSFVWLFFGSLSKDFETRVLEQLWQITIRMPRAPADSRKSQGAAAYLAAFLARAKYVKKDTAFTWLEEMFAWLRHYVDQFGSGSSQILPGLQRHGTFYAVAQSFFLVFAFRYKEFSKSHEMLEKMRRWGVGRVVHSPLEPLRFVSKPVARCFSAITRSLQLVYCNHVIPIEEVNRPFEDMFPFDSYHLKVSSQFVIPLMRKFSPLAEDLSTLTKALCWNAAASEKSDKSGDTVSGSDGGLDFLDEEDAPFVSGFRERTISCGQSSLINYSATPGLKSFNV